MIYRTIILPVLLFGCEAWSPTLRKKHRQNVFEIRVLRRIYGHKKDEVTREWGKLHSEELNDTYCSPNIMRVVKSRIMRCAGYVSFTGERRGRWRVCLQKPEGNRTLVSQRRRSEENIRWMFRKLDGGHGLD